MNSAEKQKAVIYCRVASANKTREGGGLDAQETRCREFASRADLDVFEVFRDEASGASAARPGVQAMLAFLMAHRAEGCVIIMDDIARLARSMTAHLELRSAIALAGATVRSPDFAFGEDPESKLQEHMLAAAAEYQRHRSADPEPGAPE